MTRAVIFHLSVQDPQHCGLPLSLFLQQSLAMSDEQSADLLDLGALYLNQKRLKHREALQVPMSLGDYLRVHSEPRRFPVENFNWAELLHTVQDEFVVLKKPRGVPTHASVDNQVEHCAYQVARVLGSEVYVTHRLDVATAGLLVLARTKNFQREFNQALQAGLVHKEYEALTDSDPGLGLVRHYMQPTLYSPKTVSRTPMEGWLVCDLEILRVVRESDGHFRVRIRLLTGRTHQIRAQLADLGAPVRGDLLYLKEGVGSKVWGAQESIELTAAHLQFSLPSHPEKKFEFHLH